jgi:hypothetical protein
MRRGPLRLQLLCRKIRRNCAEDVIKLCAKAIDHGDDGNRDAGSDQAVFDGGSAGLILQKRNKHRHWRIPRVGLNASRRYWIAIKIRCSGSLNLSGYSTFQTRPLLISNQATKGQNRPVPPGPIGTNRKTRTFRERCRRHGIALVCGPDVRSGSLADKPSRAKIQICPLWSKSGQTGVQLDCPLSAKLRHPN